MDSKKENNTTATGNSYTAKSFELLNNIGEYISEYSIGQFLLKKLDDFLWTVEKIAQWSVPITSLEKSKDTNEKSTQNTLVRPLPWILFFPALIALRILKGVVNMMAMLLGMETITSIMVVKFINDTRAKLNKIRSTGMTNALLKKTDLNYQALIKRLYSNVLSALCFQRLCMESNTNHKQNVEPMIVGSTNNEKSDVDTEEHNHVTNDTNDEKVNDNNVDEIIKRIKNYAEQPSSSGEDENEDEDGDDIDLSESEDVLNEDDDSVSSTNEGEGYEMNFTPDNKSSPHSNALESIAPSIKSQIIAEEAEDSDVSTKGTAVNTQGTTHQFGTTTGLPLNKETSSKRDLESEFDQNVDNNIDILDELIRNSIKNEIIENGKNQSSSRSSDTFITTECINKEIHSGNDTTNLQELSPKVDDCNNLKDDQFRLDLIAQKKNNYVTDNVSTITAGSSNVSNCLNENQPNSPKQGIGLNLKKHKHHRRKVK